MNHQHPQLGVVYALIEGDDLFYVGSTVNASWRWYDHSRSRGYRFLPMTILEVVPGSTSELRRAESRWIKGLQEKGFVLSNLRGRVGWGRLGTNDGARPTPAVDLKAWRNMTLTERRAWRKSGNGSLRARAPRACGGV